MASRRARPAAAERDNDPQLPPRGRYTLDPPHTFVAFAARHKLVGMVRGRFDRTAGTIVVSSEPAECSLDVSIDATSLSTQNEIRDADVKGPDFFDAARYPTITYVGRGVRRAGRGWVIDGTLKIRDVSRAVPLEFRFNGVAPPAPGSPARVGFHGRADLQRAAFGMVRELLSEIGEVSSAPDVWIEIDSEALAAEGASS